jgi:F-type H+-transporting ATPase subunit b
MFSSVNLLGIEVFPYLVIVQGGVFLLVLWFLNRTLFKPILHILHQREERTEGYLREAEDLESAAHQNARQYEEKLLSARKDTIEVKRAIVAQGIAKREELLAGARKQAGIILEEIRATIAGELATTRKALPDKIETLGRTIAEKVLGRSVV